MKTTVAHKLLLVSAVMLLLPGFIAYRPLEIGFALPLKQEEQWQVVPIASQVDFKSVFFLNDKDGWIAGDAPYDPILHRYVAVPTLFRTTDGGSSWTGHPSGPVLCKQVFFSSPNVGWLVTGAYNQLLWSKDSGNSWSEHPEPPYGRLYSITFTAPNLGYAYSIIDIGHGLGEGALWKATDGGETWDPLGKEFPRWDPAQDEAQRKETIALRSLAAPMHFVTLDLGWQVDGGGWGVSAGREILRTTDGGITWEQQTTLAYGKLNSIVFADQSRGWAVGDGGDILATWDGGASWWFQKKVTHKNLRDVTVAGGTVWAVGDDGTMLKYTFAVPPTKPVRPEIDYPIADGHFFTQTGADLAVQGYGFAVTNADGVPFWDTWQRFGLENIGYPVSQRFMWKGFLTQVFQKAVFQWRPEVGQVYFINVFDELHDAGYDPWLLAFRSTPVQLDPSFDAGKSWEQIIRDRLALLDENAAIKARYFAAPDPLMVYGLPTSRVTDMGNHWALRLQRAVMQQWKVDVPWAKAGEVTIANGGDIAKELGLFPSEALMAQMPP